MKKCNWLKILGFLTLTLLVTLTICALTMLEHSSDRHRAIGIIILGMILLLYARIKRPNEQEEPSV